MPGPAVSFLIDLILTLALLVQQKVSDSMPSLTPLSLLTVLTLTLALLAWQFGFVSESIQVQLSSHCHPHSHSGLVGLIVCEWFFPGASCVLSECPHSCSCFFGLTESEWFSRSSYLSSHSLHSHWSCLAWQFVGDSMPGPAVVLIDHSHFYFDPIGLTASE